ncbi:uncharacterized protein LOC136085974 isoform X4 [Hydra vulgaris]|uniref:Uncharacterized protein LOC136085974 isoform X4 n=1 Tax=Hydra vulgaris TaxID=6087 RepID=A0ABM4CQL1_HYDVU
MRLFIICTLMFFVIGKMKCASLNVFASKTDLKEGDNVTITTQVIILPGEEITAIKWVNNQNIALASALTSDLFAVLPNGKRIFDDRISASYQSSTGYLINLTNLRANDSMNLTGVLEYKKTTDKTYGEVYQSLFINVKDYLKSTDNCKLQDDSNSPQCKAMISWMQGNWQSDPFYKNNGLDGSLCSILNYLSKVEKFCPCAVPIDSQYPECPNKVSWMLGNWQSNPFYKNNGVDGSVCSIITYLTKVEKFCPCTVPISSQFPLCQNKVLWMLGNWKSNPFYKDNGVDGSLCSILNYLSKVEKWCPL